MNFCLQIQLDTQQKRSILERSIVVDRALHDRARGAVEVRRRGRAAHVLAADVCGDLATAGGLAIVRFGCVSRGTSSGTSHRSAPCSWMLPGRVDLRGRHLERGGYRVGIRDVGVGGSE